MNEIIGNDFDKALNAKLRFEYNGLISTEDLYELSLDDLNELYRKYSLKVDEEKSKSLLDKDKSTDNELRTSIIKHIFK